MGARGVRIEQHTGKGTGEYAAQKAGIRIIGGAAQVRERSSPHRKAYDEKTLQGSSLSSGKTAETMLRRIQVKI